MPMEFSGLVSCPDPTLWGRDYQRLGYIGRVSSTSCNNVIRENLGVPHPPVVFRENFIREMLTSYRSAKVFSLKVRCIASVPCIIIKYPSSSSVHGRPHMHTSTRGCGTYIFSASMHVSEEFNDVVNLGWP